MEGVVARRGDGEVEGPEVAAHRKRRVQQHDLGRDLESRPDPRLQRRDLQVRLGAEPLQNRCGRDVDGTPLTEVDERRRPVRIEPESPCGAPAGEQLGAIEIDHRIDLDRLGAAGNRRAFVSVSGELTGLEHGVEGTAASERRRRRPGPPQRSAAPDRTRCPGGREDVRERPVGMDAVEDDEVRPLVGEQLLEAVTQAHVPLPVGARGRAPVGGEVLSAKAGLDDDADGLREREEDRLDALRQAPGDRHRPVQMAEPRPVARREEDLRLALPGSSGAPRAHAPGSRASAAASVGATWLPSRSSSATARR